MGAAMTHATLRADPTNLRLSLLEALGLDHSDLSTDELRHEVEAEHGPLTEISEFGNRYLYLEHDGGMLMVPLRRGQGHHF
jgi:hypothetical protein